MPSITGERENGSSLVVVEAYRSTDQTGVSAGVDTPVQYNAEVHDPDGWHDNATEPSKFIVPDGKDGDYRLVGQVFQKVVATAGVTNVVIRKNGVSTNWACQVITSGTSNSLIVQAEAPLLDLVAGDEIQVYAARPDAGSFGATLTRAAIYRI